MSDHFRLSLETNEALAPLVRILRRHTEKSVSDIRQAVANRQPFLDETPHQNDYSEFIVRVTALLDDLETQGIRYNVEVDGSPESPQYLRNVFQRWREILEETRQTSD